MIPVGGRSRLLAVDALSVRYGGLSAVDDVSLEVDADNIVGLIGPNGAGKTSFIDAVTGFTPISAGSIQFAGSALTRLSAHKRARQGMTRTFQSIELFEDLTVRENLLVFAARAHWWSILRDIAMPHRVVVNQDVEWALALFGLEAEADRLPTELSQGHRNLIGLARAVASRPRLVLLDEPAAGLDTAESEALGMHLRKLPEQGIAVLLIDHDMSLVLSLCDTVYVLEFGKVIACGAPAAIRSNDRVVKAYLGERAAEPRTEDLVKPQ